MPPRKVLEPEARLQLRGRHSRLSWNFNSSLLKDKEFVQEVNDAMEKAIEQYATLSSDRNSLSNLSTEDIHFTISDQLFLDVLLMEICSKAIANATMEKKHTQKKKKNRARTRAGKCRVKRIPNKSQHRKLTLGRKILPPLLLGLELATF